MSMIKRYVGLLFIALCMTGALTEVTFAADAASTPAGTCTSDPTYNIPNQLQIITTVVDNVLCVLHGPESGVPGCTVAQGRAENLFTAINSQTSFHRVLMGLATLFIVVFAVTFMLGIVQLTIIEFVIRAIKISLVLMMISPAAWDFFYNVVGVFFQTGTDWLIARSTQIALGTIPDLDPNQPFAIIDYAIATAFSAKMFVTIVAMFLTGPYGWLFGILTVIGFGSFVAALFQGVWVYLMSSVVRAFLFGLAPLFFPMFLFTRTRHLFDNWVNQLLNSLLQPVLLFTFFSFFVVLVLSAMENILKVNVCYMPGSGLFQGLPGDVVIPRPTLDNGQLFGREWSWSGPVGFPGNSVFFINILDILAFVLLTQLAWRFNGIAINIAKEISSVSITYNIPGAFTNMLSPRRTAKSRAASNSVLDHRALGSDGRLGAVAASMSGNRGGGGGNSQGFRDQQSGLQDRN